MSDMEGKDRPPSHEEKTGRSFRGQMMGSISHRLKREKEEMERWSEHRQKTADSSRWSFTFGELSKSNSLASQLEKEEVRAC